MRFSFSHSSLFDPTGPVGVVIDSPDIRSAPVKRGAVVLLGIDALLEVTACSNAVAAGQMVNANRMVHDALSIAIGVPQRALLVPFASQIPQSVSAVVVRLDIWTNER